jgi:hypothetical protein
MTDQTLFGEAIEAELTPWPEGYGNRPQQVERTLFGEISAWRDVPWPEGYGGKA